MWRHYSFQGLGRFPFINRTTHLHWIWGVVGLGFFFWHHMTSFQFSGSVAILGYDAGLQSRNRRRSFISELNYSIIKNPIGCYFDDVINASFYSLVWLRMFWKWYTLTLVCRMLESYSFLTIFTSISFDRYLPTQVKNRWSCRHFHKALYACIRCGQQPYIDGVLWSYASPDDRIPEHRRV